VSDPLQKRRLKLWMRMLGVTRSVEAELRAYLRREHGTTLPRFDVMAALWRRNDALPMGELSRMLLISNGNATDVVSRLEAEDMVVRTPCDQDRRTVRVALTPAGRAAFEAMALGHEQELNRLLGALDEDDLERMREGLRKVGPKLEVTA